jgi:hypothetical protein
MEVELPGRPAAVDDDRSRTLRRQGMFAAVGLALVYPLIAIAFLHEWGQDASPGATETKNPKPAATLIRKATTEGVTPSDAPYTHYSVVGVPLALDLPDGWSGQIVDGALVMAPVSAEDETSLRLYYERGEGAVRDIARGASDYLRRLASVGKVSKPVRTQLAGERALAITARAREALYKATVCVVDGARYVTVEEWERTASKQHKTEERSLFASLQMTSG